MSSGDGNSSQGSRGVSGLSGSRGFTVGRHSKLYLFRMPGLGGCRLGGSGLRGLLYRRCIERFLGLQQSIAGALGLRIKK